MAPAITWTVSAVLARRLDNETGRAVATSETEAREFFAPRYKTGVSRPVFEWQLVSHGRRVLMCPLRVCSALC